mmetsp:Transcript_5716/g.16351  ORF Transcript_5716/g.16351 Transcript_5716/m.16351 type:complete len:782 (+) Transcript_5716:858-3203(+)|eukprot:CAMPEP_0172360214 /NCGR_PEP_ID=MMETSP1060-20121228/4289_1 /TAXON_ID=37318 /ORGANISM="Pseudo-nitzschia pungens, Strain cf. cingulata" /LENGTH=781 /DNA_ID=CAMNT_0013082155 /DNA_START=814 /DNA_END=3159 /DNA_ORIENTATION=-
MVSLDNNDLHQNSGRCSSDLQLYFRDLQQGKKKAIAVRSWSTILDVKKIIQQKIHVPIQSQRLYFGPLLTSGKALPNHRTLHDAGIYRSGETLLLEVKSGTSAISSSLSSLSPKYNSDIDISLSVINSTPRPLRSLVQEARRGLALNLKPAFILDGSGGTYFLHSTKKAKISVFKPADEEPYAENNPRGYIRQPGQDMFLREGVAPGEACVREVAAFMLDHGGFSGVPMTTLVECRHPSFNINGSRLTLSEGGASIGTHSLGLTLSQSNSSSKARLPKKVGSFQEFVRTECSMDDLSPSKISVEEVHKIAILDIRLMNADRNSANLLVRRRKSDGSLELVPIDHGFCLRSVADTSWMDWCWLDWAQLKEPMSARTKKYILNLDIEKDAAMLRDRLNICSEALAYFYASSRILKAGTKAGLSLYEIAVMCCRNDNLGEVPSKLEVLFGMAGELAESAIRDDRWGLAVASKALQEQLSPHGGSLLTPGPSSSFRRKAASAFDLTCLARTKDSNIAAPIPAMTRSAGSEESSSCSEEPETEDAEEWAAEVVNAVSLGTSTRLMAKSRSESIESDSSSEEGGFWRTSPNIQDDSWSEELESNADEDSVSWGPEPTPVDDTLGPSFLNESRMNRNMSISMNPVDMSYNPCDHERRTSVIHQTPSITPLQTHVSARSPARVSFANLNNLQFDVDIEDENYRSFEDTENVDEQVRETPFVRPLAKLGRSRSYSALSSTSIGENQAYDEKKTPNRTRITEDQYREYFLKFVDLVVVREIYAAAAAKRSS